MRKSALQVAPDKQLIMAAELPRQRGRLIIQKERPDVVVYSSAGRRNALVLRRAVPVDASSMNALKLEAPALSPSRGMQDPSSSITELLDDLRAGRRDAFDRIVPLVYQELRRAARRELAVRPSDTLFTTALVHELYLKFSRTPSNDWQDRAHFLRAAGVAMRHILVDRARRRTAEKRGGAQRPVTFDEALTVVDDGAASLLELHDALDELATIDQR